MRPLTREHLLAHALQRSLFAPTTLARAVTRLGFVQADPLRAPARAQDLMLHPRVSGYRVGDLEARYPRLALEEDFFINYGFLPRATQRLLHPREARTAWSEERWRQAREVLAIVRERGVVHPREVDAACTHGRARTGFGGQGRASTQLLDGLHFRGLLRVARREAGVRLYALREDTADAPTATPEAALDALTDTLLALYAPLPERSLGGLCTLLRAGVPQWRERCAAALDRARARWPQATVDGLRWYWPAGEQPPRRAAEAIEGDQVRLLAPFDPVVWDRRRFERFWGWAYRFEAYVPPDRRQRGHYALPLLWRGRAIGWANLALHDGALQVDTGWVSGRAPDDAAFGPALDAALDRMATFLRPAARPAAAPARRTQRSGSQRSSIA